MRNPLRSFILFGFAAVVLSSCGGSPYHGVVPGAYGVTGEWADQYRPMPDKINLADKENPQAFAARYDQTLAHCKQLVFNGGISVKSETAAGTLRGGIGGAAGGALAYFPYPPADMGMGAGLNGIFGAVTGSVNGADYGVVMQKASINQCMLDNNITVIPTGWSNWTFDGLFGHSPQASYQPGPPANYQYQPAAPPLNQRNGWLPDDNRDEYCAVLKPRGMPCNN